MELNKANFTQLTIWSISLLKLIVVLALESVLKPSKPQHSTFVSATEKSAKINGKNVFKNKKPL